MKIKGFDENLRCRGVQFEVGKTYDTGAKDDELSLCSSTVYHYCDSLQKVHQNYSAQPDSNNRFCEIEVLGAEVTDGEKIGSNKIRIVREIVGEELDILRGILDGNTGVFNSGDGNSGNRNSGSRNSGNRNSGNLNSGDGNSGDGNSGDRNSGYWNSGDWNSCNYSSGVFCSREEKIRMFNKPSNMTMQEFACSEYYRALNSVPFELTEWIQYTEDEQDTDAKKATGGYLRTVPYKEACAKWWLNMSAENKSIIMSMPNFDAEVFKEITGIDCEFQEEI